MTGSKANKSAETFRITSLQDAEKFAQHLNRYGKATFSAYDVRDHVLNVYKYASAQSENSRIKGKLLNAYIDLELTYLFMMKDSNLVLVHKIPTV